MVILNISNQILILRLFTGKIIANTCDTLHTIIFRYITYYSMKHFISTLHTFSLRCLHFSFSRLQKVFIQRLINHILLNYQRYFLHLIKSNSPPYTREKHLFYKAGEKIRYNLFYHTEIIFYKIIQYVL